MAFSIPENQVAVCATKLLIISMVAMALCAGTATRAQAQESQQSGSDESWTATTEGAVENTNPSRTTQSHSKSGNRTVDKQRVEVLGLDGHYRPDSETETETVRVNDTTRIVVREYRWDGNGRRTLSQVTEEEARSTASGDGQTVRTTSSSDVNGNLQVVKREIADTKKTSPDAQETETKVYLADGYGGFNMALQTQEVQKRSDDNKVEVKKTMLVPDGNGNWKVGEVKEKTIKEDGKKRTTEERVSRPDYEGRLSEYSRTVGEETENSAGERRSTLETYSQDVPGSADDGNMHQTQRVTTLQKRESNGETTEQQVEQPNPGNPSDVPQVTAKTKYTVRYAASGSEKTKTIQVRDGNGTFQVFYVETRKSEQVPPTQVPTAPSDKPQ
jgi:hypothetical protein